MIIVKAAANAGRFDQSSAALSGSCTTEPPNERCGALPQRLREARFTVDFCRAVYAHLDPSAVLSTAAARLNEYFGYRLALFSFSCESDLECVAFVPTLVGEGRSELQRLVLDQLSASPSTDAASGHETGVMGAEVSLPLSPLLGELRLFQVAEAARKLSQPFLEGLAECLVTALGKARDHTRLRELALRDVMTGLFNRRAFEELLSMEAARRGGGPLSLLMIDIDNFKSINDRFGHPAGDEVIAAVGKAIGEECRGSDLAARYGGEEFAVLLPGAGPANAAGVAERIRGRIASLGFSFSYEDISVTGSFGVACRDEAQGRVTDLVREADDALYFAKRSGKNRVAVYDTPLIGNS